MKKIEVIIPVFNEYECIDELVKRLNNVLLEVDNKKFDVAITFVDDGSEFEFKEILDNYSKKHSYISVLSLTRNFGHQAALRAGIDESQADALIMMDGDLQDPPEIIIEMISKWDNGADSVSCVRKLRKKESFFKKFTANIFYRLFDNNSDFKSTRNAGDFKLISKWMADEIRTITEHNLYLRGFIDWLGGINEKIYYDRDERYGGKRRYKYRQSYNVAINGLVSLSDFFPRLLNKIFIFSTLGIVFIIFWIIGTYILYPNNLAQGWSSLILTILLVLILQSCSFIFLSYYIKKILDQTSGRKNYQTKK